MLVKKCRFLVRAVTALRPSLIKLVCAKARKAPEKAPKGVDGRIRMAYVQHQ